MSNKGKILIEGVTKEGHTFRPSDWPHRLSGHLITVQNRRIEYSPLLQPITNAKGDKCVLVDPALQHSNPEVYNSVMEFAKKNNLNIYQVGEDNNPIATIE